LQVNEYPQDIFENFNNFTLIVIDKKSNYFAHLFVRTMNWYFHGTLVEVVAVWPVGH